jgi:hypothetical protein
MAMKLGGQAMKLKARWEINKARGVMKLKARQEWNANEIQLGRQGN